MYAEDTDVSVTVGGALDQCDVACLLYDSSDPSSFEVATSMMVGGAKWVWLHDGRCGWITP